MLVSPLSFIFYLLFIFKFSADLKSFVLFLIIVRSFSLLVQRKRTKRNTQGAMPH